MRGDGNDPIRDFFQDANISRIPKGFLTIGILVLLGLSILLTVFYQVEADEVAVIQRFGKYVRQTEPGLHLKLPLGLETVRKVKAQRVLKAEFGFRTDEPGVRTRLAGTPFLKNRSCSPATSMWPMSGGLCSFALPIR